MSAPRNAAAPVVADEGGTKIELDGEIRANDTTPCKSVESTRDACVMACSLPVGSCQFRCPLIGGRR